MSNPFIDYVRHYGVINTLESDLRAGLERFWLAAASVLEKSPVRLTPPDPSWYSLSRNFFSTLFLYSYFRAGIPSERRILYAAVNQCLRGMVTGCDNLLDDEYKVTLETDLPPQARRFRSVLDIMVADRALYALVQDFCRAHGLSTELALRAGTASLQALTRSGVQEASEEGGIAERLAPEAVLSQIHHLKTGVLFQSTWAIPALVENVKTPESRAAQEALYRIGIGCQMLDDIADLFVDMRERRQNYVASVIAYRETGALQERMLAQLAADPSPDGFYASNPEFAARMKAEAFAMLENGLRQLFVEGHQRLVRPAALFIADRIGVRIEQAVEH